MPEASLGESSHDVFRLCRSYEEYCFICASDTQIDGIPVIGAGVPGSSNRAGPSHPPESSPTGIGVDELTAFLDRWKAMGWQERCRKISGAKSDAAREAPGGLYCGAIIVNGSSSAVCGSLLARYLGGSVLVAGDSLVGSVRELPPSSNPAIIVAVRDEATDPVLLALLARLEAFMASAKQWEEAPLHTLLIARDLCSLSWLVARTIARRLYPEDEQADIRISHISPGISSTSIRELRLRRSDARSVTCEELGPERLIESLTMPAAALAFQTHGSDACARGGGGVVLCGLHSEGDYQEVSTTGVLACGLGHACPRGPYPLALNLVPAQILMIASCNALRLGDSSLKGDFNLGLSFVEGDGLSYVASAFATRGYELCSRAFLAAIASGRTLAESTCLINALMTASGIDRSSFIAIGMPDHSIVPRPVFPQVVGGPDYANGPLECDFGPCNFAELAISDAYWVDLLHRNRLSLSVTPSIEGEEIYWCCRSEYIDSAEDTPNQAANECIRVFLFRYPQSLGELRILPYDRSVSIDRNLEAFSGLRRWLELLRMSRSSEEDEGILAALYEDEARARELFAHNVELLKFDGSSPGLLEQQAELTCALISVARDSVLRRFLPLMKGSFWLTNVFVSEYHYVESDQARCPYCDGSAWRKTWRHPIHSEARIVDVCSRCGIVMDRMEGGCIDRLLIEATDLVPRAIPFTASVSLNLTGIRWPERIMTAVRLCLHGLAEIIPEPERWESIVDRSGAVRAEFKLLIPDHIPPHQYHLKVLVATPGEIAFAQKLLFLS